MEKFNKLVVISESEQQQSITLLAKSKGILTQQFTKLEALHSDVLKPGVLVAYPSVSGEIQQYAISADLMLFLNKASLFLYQADRYSVDPMLVINNGIRGIIFRDEQPERVVLALNTLMSGLLYYPRKVMSEIVDNLLLKDLKKQEQVLNSPALDMLTRQEKRIIQLVAKGARNKEIAENLNISAHTVKAHLSSIFRKTNARNRVELLRVVNS